MTYEAESFKKKERKKNKKKGRRRRKLIKKKRETNYLKSATHQRKRTRPQANYEACWLTIKQHLHKWRVGETRILRCMCSNTQKDTIKNKCIGKHLAA